MADRRRHERQRHPLHGGNRQRVPRRAGPRGRGFHRPPRRDPRADGRERRRQEHPDQGAHRRRARRCRRHLSTVRRIQPALPARTPKAGHQHRLPGDQPLPPPVGGGEHLPRPRTQRSAVIHWKTDATAAPRDPAGAGHRRRRLPARWVCTRSRSSRWWPSPGRWTLGQAPDPGRADLQPRRTGGRRSSSA